MKIIVLMKQVANKDGFCASGLMRNGSTKLTFRSRPTNQTATLSKKLFG